MVSKFIVLATVLAACSAVPVWYVNEVVPIRFGRSPNFSYSYGSGLASNIGGISHSSGIGTSFGDGGLTYASGVGSADGSNTFARGVGIADSGYEVYQPVAQPTYQVVPRNYGNAASYANSGYGTANSAANTGYGIANSAANTGYGAANSAANTYGGQYGSAISRAQTGGHARFGNTASSIAQNQGNGNAISVAKSGLGGQTAYSSADNGRDVSLSAAENHGAYQAASSHTLQHIGNAVQQNHAVSVNGPGYQAAHSNAVRTGYY